MKPKSIFLIMLIVILAIAACGQSTSENPVEGVLENTRPTSTATEAVAIDDFSGNLVYTKNGDLYVRFGEAFDEPTLLAQSVDTDDIYFTDDHENVIFGLPNGQGGYPIFSRNLASLAQIELHELGWQTDNLDWSADVWSPNDEWVLVSTPGIPREDSYYDIGVRVANAQGIISFVVASRQNNVFGWLTDNRLLVLEREFSNGNNALVVTAVKVLDPMESDINVYGYIDKPELLTISQDDQVFTVPSELSQFLMEQDLVLANSEAISGDIFSEGEALILHMPANEQRTYATSVRQSSSLTTCSGWEIYQEETTLDDAQKNFAVLYQVEDVAAITDIQVLKDGSLLFLEWRFPNCDYLQSPTAKLLHLSVDRAPIVIAENIARSADRHAITRPNQKSLQRFAVAPDEQSVIWIGTEEDATSGKTYQLTTVLNMTDLQTFETLAIDSSDDPNYGFGTVFWLEEF